MFGFRPDGRRVKGLDPLVQMAPYVMTQRVDAQVWTPQELDYDKLAAYTQEQRALGRTISFMSIIIAGYVRTVATYPELNRFVVNKQNFGFPHKIPRFYAFFYYIIFYRESKQFVTFALYRFPMLYNVSYTKAGVV